MTNPWFPLKPGTRWTYQETTEDGEVVEVVVTATSVTRKIANGVTARVVRDTVTLDGEIIEDTLDWYAQDEDGTVWYLGEDTAEFEDGKITTREGSFEAGVDGAQAGVIMPASPEVGMAYRQEYYEGEAEDNGEVLALGQQASVPAGEYDDLLRPPTPPRSNPTCWSTSTTPEVSGWCSRSTRRPVAARSCRSPRSRRHRLAAPARRSWASRTDRLSTHRPRSLLEVVARASRGRM